MTKVTWGCPRRDELEGRRRKDAEVPAGPNQGSKHAKGLARAALKAPPYLRQRRISLRLRLRPEGSFLLEGQPT